MSVADNYLFLQAAIEARLTQEFEADNVPVEGVESLATAAAEDRRPAVLHVMWAGDQVSESDSQRAGRGASQLVDQRWLVSLYLSYANLGERSKRNTKAGTYLFRIHKALAGWQPDGQARPFRRSGSPSPSYTKTSGMYPLGFVITLNL